MQKKKFLDASGEWILFGLGIIGNICTIVSTFISGRNGKNWHIIIALSVSIILMIFYSLKRLNKAKQLYAKKMYKYSDIVHDKNSKIKNEIYKIRSDYENNELIFRLLDEQFRKIVRFEVEVLSKTLTDLTNQDICVCVKYFVSEESDLMKGKVRTLVRSSNSQAERNERIHAEKISDISDFIQISLGNEDYFYCNNLLKFQDYKNIYDWRKYYQTKIVVPIRTNIEDDNGNILIDNEGFICVDCNKADVFEDELKTHLNFIFATANNLFTYFNDYKFYCSELNKNPQTPDEPEVASHAD